MASYKSVVRQMLRFITRTNLPGRSMLVETLRPFIIPKTRIITQAYDNLVFELDLHDLVQRQIFFEIYDREEIDLLRRVVNEGDIVFDVGGNVGLYAISLAKMVGSAGKVHVFEPIFENMQAICRNVSLNHFEDRVILNLLAIAEKETVIDLYFSSRQDNTGWASIVPSKFRENRLQVQAVNLDTYIRKNDIENVKLIKMDIEGAELYALRGMDTILRKENGPVIYLEINPYLLDKQKVNPADVKKQLVDYGYRLFRYRNKRLIPVSPDMIESQVCNILATKYLRFDRFSGK